MGLSLRNITCARGDRVLFRDLTVQVARGEALVVRGANGSGKSSLLRIIGGLLKPAAGEIAWEGATEDAPIQSQLHYIGHLDALKPMLTVRETLAFRAHLLGGEPDLGPALRAWGLESLADLPCGVLSAGQKRRVALAQLDLADRALWLLDEPTGPLDEAGAELVAGAIRHQCGRGGTVIVATHRVLDLGEAQLLDLGPGSDGPRGGSA